MTITISGNGSTTFSRVQGPIAGAMTGKTAGSMKGRGPTINATD